MRKFQIELPASRLAYEDALRSSTQKGAWGDVRLSGEDLRLLGELLEAIQSARPA